MARWEFGAAPLDQTRQAAARLRRVTGLLLAAESDDPAVDDLLAALDRFEAAFDAAADRAPRVGAAVDGDGRVYLDHARDIGAYNPCFPTYDLVVDGDRATGTVTFPIAYEGPPGIVHGGFLALLFDCAVQHHNCEVGVAGKTMSLELRYRRPVPLLAPLSITLERRTEDGRIHSTAQLSDGDHLLCTAEIAAVAGDRANLPAVSSRRDGGEHLR